MLGLPPFALLLQLGASAEPAGFTLTVEIEGLRNNDGQVLASLYGSADGFPGETDKALRKARTTSLSGDSTTIVFKGVPPGHYAVAVFHDENGNGKLDTNVIGIPKEGVGASNRARGRMGPPKWKDARLLLTASRRTAAKLAYF